MIATLHPNEFEVFAYGYAALLFTTPLLVFNVIGSLLSG